jgi:hypothetical protein
VELIHKGCEGGLDDIDGTILRCRRCGEEISYHNVCKILRTEVSTQLKLSFLDGDPIQPSLT